MILVFIFLFLLLGIIFSKIDILIENLCIKANLEESKITSFYIKAKLKLYEVIPIISCIITERDIRIFGIKVKYNKLLKNTFFRKRINQVKTNFKIKRISLLKPNIKSLIFKLDVGTESIITTSFLVVILSVLFSNFFRKIVNILDLDKFNYKVIPNYEEKNRIYLELKARFIIKTNNIINCFKYT